MARKQNERQNINPDVTADLTAKNAFIFANDDGSVRTYFGSRKIFDGWKKRHKLTNYNIHFHGLRHTFSNMLFEMNENPKVIQQLLGTVTLKQQSQFITLLIANISVRQLTSLTKELKKTKCF